MDSLYIIDASGYLHRAYHAIPHMTNSEGSSTNALFGFVRSLMKLTNDFSPKNIVCVFDGKESIKKRKEIYKEYKSHRPSMQEDLAYQIEWAMNYCEISGIPLLAIPEVEADDTIGSIAKWAEKNFEKVYLCTSDKDMAQLVNEKIALLNTHKDNLVLGPKEVEVQFGVKPSQILDYLALTGDVSDNIPGVSGFGPKSASSLLKEFETLENALKHCDKIPGKKGEILKAEKDTALLSRSLALIHTDVHFPKDLEFFMIKLQDEEKLIQFYNKMSFHSLIKEIPQKKQQVNASYHLVDNEKSVEDLKEALRHKKEIAFDVKGTNEKPMWADLIGVSFAPDQKTGYYVPLNGTLGRKEALALLKEIFLMPHLRFVGHNAKFGMIILKKGGIDLKVSFDTILASTLINSNERQHSLDILSSKHFGFTKIKLSELLGKGKQAISLDLVSLEKISDYCCEDAHITYLLKDLFQKKIETDSLERVYYDLELPLLKVLAKMEMNGIYLDRNYLEHIKKDVSYALENIKREIFQIAGVEFNLNSPKQLSEILFTKLLIRPPKKTATGYSTNQEVLEELRDTHPIAEKLIEWRTLEKLRSTYIDTLPQEIHPKTERIHTTFNQFVAATGRLSSEGPNLQNIPTRNPLGQLIREAFKPQKEGWSFFAGDYSQIELRLLAHESEDPVLIEAFVNGEDIHATTAALIFGIPLSSVNKEMRYLAKAVNFGILYGQGAFGLSQTLKIELKEAKKFIETYFARFPNVKSYIEESKEKVRKTGKAMTFTGRVRPLPEIHSSNMHIKALAERLAVNTPLQGGAADLIKMAMLNIDEEITRRDLNGFMILQIHDELLFEVPDHEISVFQLLVKEIMENIYPLKVPLVVNCKVGKNWKEC